MKKLFLTLVFFASSVSIASQKPLSTTWFKSKAPTAPGELTYHVYSMKVFAVRDSHGKISMPRVVWTQEGSYHKSTPMQSKSPTLYTKGFTPSQRDAQLEQLLKQPNWQHPSLGRLASDLK